jgi:hypothetical protein
MNARVNPLAGLDADLEDDQPEAPEVAVLPSKVSVQLNPRLYFQLVEFCSAAARLRGKRVTHVEVFRALAAELFSDPELSKRILARLRK